LHVESVSDRGRYDSTNQTVRWEDVRLGTVGGQAVSTRLSMTFREKVLSVSDDASGEAAEMLLRGTYKLSTDGTESPISLAVFLPTGKKRDITSSCSTQFEGHVQFDLLTMTCQSECALNGELGPFTVVPDEKLASGIVSVLSEADVYVARIRESPPTTDPKSANVKNRYWDILGRMYVGDAGMFGIDVHVVVGGSETYLGQSLPSYGSCTVSLTISAKVHDADAKHYVETTRDGLLDQLKVMLEQRHSQSSGQLPSHAGMTEANVSLPDRIGELEKRKVRAEDALLEGRITEETYRHIVEDVDSRLRGLKQNMDGADDE